MDTIIRKIKVSKFIGIYFVSFLFALQVALPIYVNSSFLAQLVGTDRVGLAYATASLITILGFFIITPLLHRFGNYRVGLTLLLILFVALITLSFATNILVLLTMALVLLSGIVIVRFSLDVILETYSSDTITGNIRGEFGTIWNIPWIIAPLIAGVLLINGSFGQVYLAAAIILIPAILIFARTFRSFHDPEYHHIPFTHLLREVLANKDLSSIFVVGFLLQFFFSWMVFYAPIYLHEVIGFSWPQIGILLAIALVPYIIFQWPLGRIADTKVGEKELLSLGFVIMALSTAMMSFITVAHMIIWMILLFLTRVGASMVEIMSETYFFKKIDGQNVNLLGFYRTLRPLAYVLSPVVASLFLAVIDVRFLFVILGAIMLGALFYSNTITDTL